MNALPPMVSTVSRSPDVVMSLTISQAQIEKTETEPTWLSNKLH
jgi:hypothetical protein